MHEKALFDLDGEINELENVADRYPVQPEKGGECKDEEEKIVNPTGPQGRFFVKKTQRPAFLDPKVLADLAAIRQPL